MKKENERLEQEILANAGKDICADYEMLTCDDFERIWGEHGGY